MTQQYNTLQLTQPNQISPNIINNNPQIYITNMSQSPQKTKQIILLVTTITTISAFILNTWYNEQIFKYNLHRVPELQHNQVLGSDVWIVLMNIVSNLFNPVICAGYVMGFYLVSHRRFQILVFLVWFIFLSVFLTFMKSLIQQARPYWINTTDINMLQWTCYSQFGCPSGHSMLGLILIQFMIRYFSRAYKLTKRTIIILVIFGVILQGLVVFSRIILGMHSINQVLFGVLLGFYFLIPYYMYMQKIILKICLKACSKSYRKSTLIITTILMLIMIILSMMVAFLPQYANNSDYMNHIHTFQRCKNVQYYQSFQYKCLQDSALVLAVFGVFYGLVFLRGQERLMKVIMYKRNSMKYVIRLILSVLMAIIPVALFMNPLWKQLDLTDTNMAILLFFLQGAGLGLGNFVLVGLGPVMLEKCKLQNYFTHDQGKQHLSYRTEQIRVTQSQISQKLNLLKQQESLMDTYARNQSINIPR